ncbi:lambda-exonuclease family protein [Sphingosinicellaceae bacterium M-36]
MSADRPYDIVTLEQGSAAWRAWRHGGIGASDAPAIMGENPWRSARAVLREKRQPPVERYINGAMARGSRLEPVARRRYVERTGIDVVPVCLQHRGTNWLRASADGLSAEGGRLVEIKCGESVYRKTAEARRVPRLYVGQVQHQLAVTGLEAADFFCHWPGLPDLLVTVARDEDYIARLLEAEQRLWEAVIAP